MTITNIMHVTGSKADLYSSDYFKSMEGIREPVNPFTKWVDGHLYAFGTREVIVRYEEKETGRFTERIALDLTAAQEGLGLTGDSDDPMQEIEDKLNEDEEASSQYFTSNPPIPPSNSHVDWNYQYQIKEHQFSNWVVDPNDSQSGRWEATTEEETQWLKDDGSVITPVTSDHATAQSFFHYYYINKFDYPDPKLIDLDLFVGEDIEVVREALKDHFEQKYPRWAEDHEGEQIVIEIKHVDVRQAHHADADTEHDATLMGYWLGKIDNYPKMISVDQHPDVVGTFGSHTELNMEGDFEYRHALHDAVFKFKKRLVDPGTTLPVCNGLCCYPRVYDGKIYASEGQRLSYNEKDRNRRWVLVDFSPVGGCKFVHLSELKGTLSEFIMPEDYDPTTQSVLLVLRGRLFFPHEFEIVNRRLLFKPNKYSVIYELDRMLCRGDYVYNTTTLEPKKKQTKQVIKSGVSSITHDPDETIGDREGEYYVGNRTFVNYPNGTQKIEFCKKVTDEVFSVKYKPTLDNWFHPGKKYFYRDWAYNKTNDVRPDASKQYYISNGDGTYRDAIVSDFTEAGAFKRGTDYYEKSRTGEYVEIEGWTNRYISDYSAYYERIEIVPHVGGNGDEATKFVKGHVYYIRKNGLYEPLDLYKYWDQYISDTELWDNDNPPEIFLKKQDPRIIVYDYVEYYVNFDGDLIVVDPSILIGQSTTEARAVGIYDTDNVHKTFVHQADGQILFNKFYEDKTDYVPVFDRGWSIKITEPVFDIKNDDNSFLIIINNPGLQIVKHHCFEGPKPFTKMKWGSDSHAGLMRVDFDRQSRGLLFDEVTRSIIDYTRETQSMTFYVDKCRKWGIANCYIHWPTPIAVMDESSHNLMSARGFTLDDANTFKYDHIVWPNLSMLDFIFRG